MAKHAYYMTQRPFSIGAQPNEGFVEAEDLDGKKHIEDIDREAWPRIVYDRELTEQEIEQYELVPAEPKLYFGYVKYADGSTMCHAKGTLAEVKASEERVEEVIVTANDGYEKHLTPLEAAQEIAGTAFRKHVEGQKTRTRWSYGYGIGAQLLEYANYGNGYVEHWSYVRKES